MMAFLEFLWWMFLLPASCSSLYNFEYSRTDNQDTIPSKIHPLLWWFLWCLNIPGSSTLFSKISPHISNPLFLLIIMLFCSLSKLRCVCLFLDTHQIEWEITFFQSSEPSTRGCSCLHSFASSISDSSWMKPTCNHLFQSMHHQSSCAFLEGLYLPPSLQFLMETLSHCVR